MSAAQERTIEQAFESARHTYRNHGVDVEAALRRLESIPISMHCWQGDDVAGFEGGSLSDGGILATGAYPGRARDGDELRADIDKALNLIPGQHRVNLHAIYAEPTGTRPDRDTLAPEHFSRWIDWAVERGLGLDFNPTFFSHPMLRDGFTLASRDEGVRRFWIDHGRACRRIAQHMGSVLGTPCINNIWIPDGFKDTPADRWTPRKLLRESLDAILEQPMDRAHMRDAVESKLFGIGSESYVVGSAEFYLGYAVQRNILLCLDSGHFHPTESVADKLSSVLMQLDGALLHVSRPVRWDSDHVVTLDEQVRAIAGEVVGGHCLDRVHIGLDFFDASINRIAAWIIGMRSMLKALLEALLMPRETLVAMEAEGDYTGRLALLEECRTLPLGAVWDYYCLRNSVPPGLAWLQDVRQYEKDVLGKRS